MALASYLRQYGIEEVDERLFTTNGVRLEVTSCGQGGKLALLLHGFPEHAFSWRNQVPLLYEMGYKVWVPNLRGYGRSEQVKGRAAYRISELVEDIAGLIDVAQPDEVTLVGHDWGGLIAWEFALRQIRPLERLVIMNAPHPAILADDFSTFAKGKKSHFGLSFFQLPFLPELALGWKDAKKISKTILKSTSDKSLFNYDILHVYRDNAMRPGTLTAMLNYYRANFNGRTPKQGVNGFSCQQTSSIETPTLLIWGEQDMSVDVSLSEGTENFVQNLSLEIIPQAAHWVQQEAPDEVNAILNEWLKTPLALLVASEIPEAENMQVQETDKTADEVELETADRSIALVNSEAAKDLAMQDRLQDVEEDDTSVAEANTIIKNIRHRLFPKSLASE